ncbi:MAG TPA: energy transducer TonB [Gallionella sp.]|nr:energy transducer TonB [Gallionella sp.]
MTMQTPYNRHPLQAFGLAIGIELVLLAGAGLALAQSDSAKSALSAPVPIMLSTEDPQPKKPPEPKPVPKPQPRPVPRAPAPPKPAPQPLPPAPVPTAFTRQVPPPPPPVPAVPSKVMPSADYLMQINAAVKAAHTCPAAAADLHYTGKVRVDFRLDGSVPGAIKLLVASGYSMIDRAALQAVQNAHYPEQPPEIRGTDYVYQVWIECN